MTDMEDRVRAALAAKAELLTSSDVGPLGNTTEAYTHAAEDATSHGRVLPSWLIPAAAAAVILLLVLVTGTVVVLTGRTTRVGTLDGSTPTVPTPTATATEPPLSSTPPWSSPPPSSSPPASRSTASSSASTVASTSASSSYAQSAAPAPPDALRFDGMGDVTLGMPAADLLARGYKDVGNQYEGMTARCVLYTMAGQPDVSVDTTSGKVVAVHGGLMTYVGNIRVGSTLTEVRTAFADHKITILRGDFGQASSGLIVEGSPGSIGIGLHKGDLAAYAAGSVKVTWLAGVGLPDFVPIGAETGC